MGGAREVLAGDFGEDAGADPDADAGHRGQDLMKRVVRLYQGFNLGGNFVAQVAKRQQLPGQFRQHHAGCIGSHDDNALF